MTPTGDWSEFFFKDCHHNLDLEEMENGPEQCPQEFVCEKFRLIKLAARPPQFTSPALVRWMRARRRGWKGTYIAKTVWHQRSFISTRLYGLSESFIQFLEFTEKDAKAQLRRIPSTNHSPRDVQHDLDPFIIESRAFEHINRFCPESQKSVFFPEYYGVMALVLADFPYGYKFRPRAVVMKGLRPNLKSRRLLAAEVHLEIQQVLQDFDQEWTGLSSLTPFEKDWYRSLLTDRLRRVSALHDIGISHGDIRDDHFELPGDFYDTVLYDFSISYTFSPSWPYLVSRRRPSRSLKRLKEWERLLVIRGVMERFVIMACNMV